MGLFSSFLENFFSLTLLESLEMSMVEMRQQFHEENNKSEQPADFIHHRLWHFIQTQLILIISGMRVKQMWKRKTKDCGFDRRQEIHFLFGTQLKKKKKHIIAVHSYIINVLVNLLLTCRMTQLSARTVI